MSSTKHQCARALRHIKRAAHALRTRALALRRCARRGPVPGVPSANAGAVCRRRRQALARPSPILRRAARRRAARRRRQPHAAQRQAGRAPRDGRAHAPGPPLRPAGRLLPGKASGGHVLSCALQSRGARAGRNAEQQAATGSAGTLSMSCSTSRLRARPNPPGVAPPNKWPSSAGP